MSTLKYSYCGVRNCNHCDAAMKEWQQTNSGRIVYKCPDCGHEQFYDGMAVPKDLRLKPLVGPRP
jgi:Zn-finger protein